jgi:hypothetical protein
MTILTDHALYGQDNFKENHQNFDPLGLTNPENYIVGVDALRINNLIIRTARERLGHFKHHDWRVIDGHVIGCREKKTFFRGTIDVNGNWEGKRTEIKNGSRKTVGTILTDSDIRKYSLKSGGNGIWYFPQGLYQVPKNEGFQGTNVLVCEWDDLKKDPKEWLWVYVLNEISRIGLAPNFIVSSGGKCNGLSPHAHWLFDTTIKENLYLFIQYLFIELEADPHVGIKIANQYRVAGFYRDSKGNEQGIFKEYKDTPYDVKDFVDAIHKVGENLGIKLTTTEEYIEKLNAKEEAAQKSIPIDLNDFQGTDIEKLLIEVDSQFPIYTSGGNTYGYRLKFASAAKTLVGIERAIALCPNLFSVNSISWQAVRIVDSPLGLIVNTARTWLQEIDWQLPKWWRDKYPFKTAKKNRFEGLGYLKQEGEKIDGSKRAEVLMEVMRDGQIALDRSIPGEGKSHCVPILPSLLKVGERLIYVTNQHRNPTIPAINEFPDIIPRNQFGAYDDENGMRKLADSSYEGELVLEGNCHLAGIFHKLNELGHDPYESSVEGQNPVCPSCSKLKECNSEKGNFLYDSRQIKESQIYRAHIDQLSRKEDYSNTYLVPDEIETSISPTKTISADLQHSILDSNRHYPVLNDVEKLLLIEIMEGLKPLFDDKSPHGLDMEKILETLSKFKGDVLDKMILKIEGNGINFSDLLPKTESILETDGLNKRDKNELNKGARTYAEIVENDDLGAILGKISPNITLYILQAIQGKTGVILRISKEHNDPDDKRTKVNKIKAVIDNRSAYDFLNNCKGVAILDATKSSDRLAKELNLKRPIKVVHSEDKTPYKNVTYHMWRFKGIRSNNLRNEGVDRWNAARKELEKKNPDIKFISPKKHNTPDTRIERDKPVRTSVFIGDGHWGNHNRGSNAYEHLTVLGAAGMPFPNVGVIQDEYQCLYGSLEGFDEFYAEKVNAEIFQLNGRLRAQRKTEHCDIHHFVTEDYDPKWLISWGFKVIDKDVFCLTPLAGDPTQQAQHRLILSVCQLVEKNIPITQVAIADEIVNPQTGKKGISQPAVHKILSGLKTTAKAIQNITVRILSTNTHGYISTTPLYFLLCKEFGLPYNEVEVNPEAEKMDKNDFITQPSEKIPTEIPLDMAATDIPDGQKKVNLDGQNSVVDIHPEIALKGAKIKDKVTGEVFTVESFAKGRYHCIDGKHRLSIPFDDAIAA